MQVLVFFLLKCEIATCPPELPEIIRRRCHRRHSRTDHPLPESTSRLPRSDRRVLVFCKMWNGDSPAESPEIMHSLQPLRFIKIDSRPVADCQCGRRVGQHKPSLPKLHPHQCDNQEPNSCLSYKFSTSFIHFLWLVG